MLHDDDSNDMIIAIVTCRYDDGNNNNNYDNVYFLSPCQVIITLSSRYYNVIITLLSLHNAVRFNQCFAYF